MFTGRLGIALALFSYVVFVLLALSLWFACLLICFSAEFRNRQVANCSRPISMIDDSM